MTSLAILIPPGIYGCGEGDLHCKVSQSVLQTESCLWFGRPRCSADTVCSADYSYPFTWLRCLIYLFKLRKHKKNIKTWTSPYTKSVAENELLWENCVSSEIEVCLTFVHHTHATIYFMCMLMKTYSVQTG